MTISRIGSRLSKPSAISRQLSAKKLKADSCKLKAMKGFTLIEVLMAISFLAIGVVGVLRAYSTSVTAMEISQYNIDAACLLKTVMGDVEEKSINSWRGMLAGRSKGAYTASTDIKTGTTCPGKWQWDKEAPRTDLKVIELVAVASATDPEKKPEEIVIYYLDEVKVTVVNPGCSPARRVSVVTYMERYPEDHSV